VSTSCIALLTAITCLAQGPAPINLQPPANCPPPTCKVCVSEPKPTTRNVFSTKCEDYCLPRCNLLALLKGTCDCKDGACGEVRVRHRLVVKKVPDCDKMQCVPREVPVACPVPCMPREAPVAFTIPPARREVPAVYAIPNAPREAAVVSPATFVLPGTALPPVPLPPSLSPSPPEPLPPAAR
jgi:hypothetical protein